MPVLPDASLAILVLAAGGGKRLGGGKLLLPWHGKAILLHTLARVTGMRQRLPIHVVIGSQADQVRQAINEEYANDPAVRIIENKAWSAGQSISLTLGIAEIAAAYSALQGVMVVLGDQPLLKSATLDLLAETHIETCRCHPGHLATAPVYDRQRGNPVIVSPALFPQIASLQGDVGARNILRTLDTCLLLLPVDDPGVLKDIDTPEQYQALTQITAGDRLSRR